MNLPWFLRATRAYYFPARSVPVLLGTAPAAGIPGHPHRFDSITFLLALAAVPLPLRAYNRDQCALACAGAPDLWIAVCPVVYSARTRVGYNHSADANPPRPCPREEENPPMRFARSRRFLIPAVVLLCFALTVSGCHVFHPAAKVAAAPKPLPPAKPLPLDLAKVQPNEAGVVPILEYHDLVKGTKVTGYQYPAEAFRKDITWLYAHNYRPVSLSDYVNAKIDCPPGTSPVILTFDDALRGQFSYGPDGKVDPDCAIGILEAFHAQHADWPLRGTFFVLTDGDPKLPPAFYQKASSQAKMEALVRDGFEIGNHTIHHRLGIRHWPDSQVQAEFAGAVANIHKLLPSYHVQTLALPFGVYPSNRKLVVSGQSGSQAYHNICALLAGAGPAPSPMATEFKPYRLPRIIPGNEKFALRYWMDYLQANKEEKYVSDGDPNTFTVSLAEKGSLNAARLHNAHLFLRTYSGTQIVSDGTAPPPASVSAAKK